MFAGVRPYGWRPGGCGCGSSSGNTAAPGGFSPSPWPGGDEVETVESIDGLLDEARAALGGIEDEIRRLGAEVTAFRLGASVPFDPANLEPLVSGYENLIAELEEFVRGTFARVEKKALAGDANAARSLRDATLRILGASREASPSTDFADNARKTVGDATRELKSLVEKIVGAVGVGAAILIGLRIVDLLMPSRKR